MNRFDVMYRLGFAPWERRNVEQTWKPLLEGPNALAQGRALDVGCGSGRDAVYLAKHGWQVTGVDFADTGLKAARQRAQDEGVEVQWVKGDVAELGGLGLAGGYGLLVPGAPRPKADACSRTSGSSPSGTLPRASQ